MTSHIAVHLPANAWHVYATVQPLKMQNHSHCHKRTAKKLMCMVSYIKEFFSKPIVTNFDCHISTNKTISNCKVAASKKKQQNPFRNLLNTRKTTDFTPL